MSEQLSEEQKIAGAVINLTVLMRDALINTDDGCIEFSGRISPTTKSLRVLGISQVEKYEEFDSTKKYVGIRKVSGDMDFIISPEAAKALSEAGVRSPALDVYLPKQPEVSVGGVSGVGKKPVEIGIPEQLG